MMHELHVMPRNIAVIVLDLGFAAVTIVLDDTSKEIFAIVVPPHIDHRPRFEIDIWHEWWYLSTQTLCLLYHRAQARVSCWPVASLNAAQHKFFPKNISQGTNMSATQDLYDFAGRYRIALKKDKPHLSALINLCIPDIPARLHSQIYTPTCCLAVVRNADKSFTIHVAFIRHDLIIKYRMDPPCNGSCSFYKLREDKVPKDIHVSTLRDEIREDEEWCIVSSKDRDSVLMPPPLPRKQMKIRDRE